MNNSQKKSIAILTPGVLLGYAYDPKQKSYVQLFYVHKGLHPRVCERSEVNFNKFFQDDLWQCSSFTDVQKLLETTNFVDTQLIKGQDALLLNKSADFVEHAESNTDDTRGYFVAGVMIGFIYNNSDDTFNRVYYTRDTLFLIPCSLNEVSLEHYLNVAIFQHEHCSDLQDVIVQYSKVDRETLIASDAHANELIQKYSVSFTE